MQTCIPLFKTIFWLIRKNNFTCKMCDNKILVFNFYFSNVNYIYIYSYNDILLHFNTYIIKY